MPLQEALIDIGRSFERLLHDLIMIYPILIDGYGLSKS